MRYFINFDKVINQLVPYYLGGRKLILYLQAILSPLRQANDDFVEWAKETRIEAAMTSQIFKFEWYLNHKLSKYFASEGKIHIKNSEALGTPIYWESANVDDEINVVLRQEPKYSGGSLVEGEEGDSLVLYRSDERTAESTVSFVVTSPKINTALISEAKYLGMLKYLIDKYRLANKTYLIKYE